MTGLVARHSPGETPFSGQDGLCVASSSRANTGGDRDSGDEGKSNTAGGDDRLGRGSSTSRNGRDRGSSSICSRPFPR